jgi:hypothetical protein
MTTIVKSLVLPLVALFALAVLVIPRTAHADDLADAKTFITKQVALIKKGDATALKAGFTRRLQAKVTETNVKKAQGAIAKMTIDELVASVIPGKDSLKIKMKNGRSLTTLVKVDGAWLADTIWFK